MAPSPIRRTPLILHVEDDKSQADMLKSILEGSGFVVLQASTAEEALRLFQQEPTVTLVLADHMLGGKNRGRTCGSDKKSEADSPGGDALRPSACFYEQY